MSDESAMLTKREMKKVIYALRAYLADSWGLEARILKRAIVKLQVMRTKDSATEVDHE